MYIYKDDARKTRRQIDLAELASTALAINEIELADAEIVLSVRLAIDVDDGEAQALAVASIRDLPMLSDDLGAARVAERIGVRLETTLDLIEVWSQGQPKAILRDVLTSLRARASYVPPGKHPLRDWFSSLSEETTDP